MVGCEAIHPLKSARQSGATTAASSGITLYIGRLEGEVTLTTITR
jgi:hypothetical protein